MQTLLTSEQTILQINSALCPCNLSKGQEISQDVLQNFSLASKKWLNQKSDLLYIVKKHFFEFDHFFETWAEIFKWVFGVFEDKKKTF